MQSVNLIIFQKKKKILNKNKQKATSEMANICGILESKIVGQISVCLVHFPQLPYSLPPSSISRSWQLV